MVFPWLAFAVSAAFAALWAWRRLRRVAVAAIVWACYGVYEYLMKARIRCSGECNIRVDCCSSIPCCWVHRWWRSGVPSGVEPARRSG